MGFQVLLVDEPLSESQRFGLFAVSRVYLNTSVRRDVSMMPQEFVAANGGPMVLSEFLGVSNFLGGSIRVNPWNVEDVVSALDNAVNVGAQAWAPSRLRLKESVNRHDITRWSTSLLQSLSHTSNQEPERALTFIGEDLGQTYDLHTLPSEILPKRLLFNAYLNSSRRLIILDCSVLLSQTRPAVDGNSQGPSEKVISSLRALAADERNYVFLLSGLGRELLEDWFGGIPGLGLGADHGLYYRWSPADTWCCRVPGADMSWTQAAKEIMGTYTERTDGTWIEVTESSVVSKCRTYAP